MIAVTTQQIEKASTIKYKDGTKVKIAFGTDPKDGAMILGTDKVNEARMVRDNLNDLVEEHDLDGWRCTTSELHGKPARKFRSLTIKD